VVIIRLHHAVVDGVAGLEAFGALLDPDPSTSAGRDRSGTRRPDGPAPAPPLPSAPALLARSAWDAATMPAAAVRSAAMLARAVRAGDRAAGGEPRGRLFQDGGAALFNRRVRDSSKSLALVELPLDQLKATKNVLGVTLTDLILASVTASLRSYLLERGEPVDAGLSALCPINVRVGGEGAGYGNHWAMMFNRLPVGTADPLEQLRTIRSESSANRRAARARAEIGDPAAAIATIVPPPAWPLIGRLLGSPIGGLMPPIANLQVSSIPGSPQPLYLAGARLLHIHSRTFVQQGSGLFIACIGYDGTLDVGITAIRELVPDPERIATGMRDHLELLGSLGERAAPGMATPLLGTRP
jgi:WS/DGAT/MGAT family acyltransferase